MKKSFKIIITLTIFVLLFYMLVFGVDYYRCSNMKLPVFAIKVNDNTYYGLGYRIETENKEEHLTKVEMYMFNNFITGAITDYTNNNYEKNEINYDRVIMIDNKLYYDTGEESNIIHTCGTMDGYIESNVDFNILPAKNNESNFEGKYGYQYGNKDEIELKINEKWYVFKLK